MNVMDGAHVTKGAAAAVSGDESTAALPVAVTAKELPSASESARYSTFMQRPAPAVTVNEHVRGVASSGMQHSRSVDTSAPAPSTTPRSYVPPDEAHMSAIQGRTARKGSSPARAPRSSAASPTSAARRRIPPRYRTARTVARVRAAKPGSRRFVRRGARLLRARRVLLDGDDECAPLRCGGLARQKISRSCTRTSSCVGAPPAPR